MSRGIDVKEINLVINYDVPHDAEDYVHRVGRTARVNAKGEAITLVTQKEIYRLRKIERLIKAAIPKIQPPEGLGLGHAPEWGKSSSGSGRKTNTYRKKRYYNRNR